MIANPNGITCDRCGFINTSGAILTTGKPQFDTQGALEALNVTKGLITIDEKGLHGQSTDYIDIISRTTKLNGNIQASNLALTQGANHISFKEGTIKTISGEGTTPQLAVNANSSGGLYANRIRLISTEDGAEVNLNDLTSTQGDITLNANGKMRFGDITAKNDLNIGAKEIDIALYNKIKTGRNITLVSSTLDNKGNLNAGQDMRIFSEIIRNTGDRAFLQANNNMWIQKNSKGDKSNLIENKSSVIKTNNGDLIVRTEKLDNVRIIESIDDKEIYGNSSSKNERQAIVSPDLFKELKIKPKHSESFNYSKWFGIMDFNKNDSINVKKYLTQYEGILKEQYIESGGNLYINATELNNKSSIIHSKGDLILTGRDLNVTSIQNGEKNLFHKFTYFSPCISLGECSVDATYLNEGEIYSWENDNSRISSLLRSEGNFVADFSNSINIKNNKPNAIEKLDEITTNDTPYESLVSMKNMMLSSNLINSNDNIKSHGDISILANDNIGISQSKIFSENSLSIIAPNNVEITQSDLKAKDITLISKEGDIKVNTDNTINYFLSNGVRWLSGIEADRDLTISAGNKIVLSNLTFKPQTGDITVTANQGLTINYDDLILKNNKKLSQPFNKESELRSFNEALSIEKLNTTGSVYLNSGNQSLKLRGIGITAGKDISLTSAKDIDLDPRIIERNFSYRYWGDDNLWMHNNPMFSSIDDVVNNNLKDNSGEIQSAQDPFQFWISPSIINKITSKIQAGGDILINAGENLSGQSAILSSEGHTLLSAGKNISFNSFPYSTISTPLIGYEWEQQGYHLASDIKGQKNLTLTANGALTTQGTSLYSGGDINLISGNNMHFESAQNGTHKVTRNSESTTVTHKGTEITSDGNLNILTNGSLLFQATKLVTKGAMNIAAKGGYLYAQAQEEVIHEKSTNSKTSWGGFGKTKTSTKNHHEVTNKVAEFIASGDINLLSRDDSTYEASKIETDKNATLTSTHGKVNFNAVKDTEFDQVITHSRGFYIKNQDKGYSKETWVLPSVNIGGALSIDAANGISADIKTQKGQSLQAVLTALGNNPETAWLKELSHRKDVHWTEVQDAYEQWDYKQEQLNPVVSAVIAIAVAAVTAGSGLAVAAGASAASTATGVGAATAATATTTGAVVSGATIAGISSLASKAAVSLVENKGNLSKTFKELSKSDTVKSIATSMAIGGALSGFDQAMGWTAAKDGTNTAVSSTNSNLPLLSKGDWIKTAQRVAGQSMINSSLNTAINGGSFKDNFATALLANVGNQINAEGANLIGNNGEVLGIPGKTISHAVVSALAAEIGGGDAKGAAAGALAAELAAVVMESTLFEPKYKNVTERQIHKIQEALTGNETKTQTAKVIGALSGALISGTPDGVYSAANSAELVYRYNYTEHMLDQIARENGVDMAAAKKGDQAAAERVAARRDGAVAALAVAAGGYATVYGGYILVGSSAEMVMAGRAAFEACTTQPTLCVNNMTIFTADTIAPEAAMGIGPLAAGTVKVLGYSSESAKNLANELSHASTILLKNEKPNTHVVTNLIEQEAKRTLENYRVYDLNKVTDRALDLNKIRLETQQQLKRRYREDTPVSYAAASVTTDGKTEYYLSVSGKAWSGNAPTTVSVNGVDYRVILTDSESIPSIGNIETKKTNFNHAEQKLFSHIRDAYKGQKADVNIAVQNTSIGEPGMCFGCGYTSQNFAEMNKNFNVNIFQGSTGVNP
ncbi:DUF637 domain-containing protein [Xenorhabdus sp. 18]|nr:DUF637 domain-containing protein [Xenorhabdus sp. 18]